jgi:hypothetical protein
MKYFFEELCIDEQDKVYADETTQNTTFYTKDHQLFIQLRHPGVRKLSQEVYCNEIISVAEKWWKKRINEK